jgi:predicted metal-dependent HD superfamily phosphohydrolase
MIFCTDEGTGYIYHMDYLADFLSPERSNIPIREVVRHDFVFNLVQFLTSRLKVGGNAAFAVGNSLFALMSCSNRHYHTPYHILHMFLFAAQHGIKLKDWEHLAVWFHNASYMPLAPLDCNQHQSVHFMRAVLPHGYMLSDNGIVNQADRAIIHTSKRLEEKVPEEYEVLLDLDMSIYAAPPRIFDAAMLCLRTEFSTESTVRRFKVRQRKALEQLLKRSLMFRTPRMRHKYEDQAHENAERALKEVTF